MGRKGREGKRKGEGSGEEGRENTEQGGERQRERERQRGGKENEEITSVGKYWSLDKNSFFFLTGRCLELITILQLLIISRM